jgi:hypothetical protein
MGAYPGDINFMLQGHLFGAAYLERTSWFHSIPPERIGLSGEYDHNGLANRVVHRFQETFGSEILSDLAVCQRGKVVILNGRVPNRAVLQRLIWTAASVEGAASVELRGVVVESEEALAVA